MPNPNAPGQQKHQLHDALEKHIIDWSAPYGVTYDKHEIDEALRIGHAKASLDQVIAGDKDPLRLRRAIAFTGAFAHFMQLQGADDPLVGATVEAMEKLLTS